MRIEHFGPGKIVEGIPVMDIARDLDLNLTEWMSRYNVNWAHAKEADFSSGDVPSPAKDVSSEVAQEEAEPCEPANKKAKVNCSGMTCVVCGDTAFGLRCEAIVCEACIVFFRRAKCTEIRLCRRKGQCEVTYGTRNRCSSCRLQKCLAMGMKWTVVHPRRRWALPQLKKLSNTRGLLGSEYSRGFGVLNHTPGYPGASSGTSQGQSTPATEPGVIVNRSCAVQGMGAITKDSTSKAASNVAAVGNQPVVPEKWKSFPLKSRFPLPPDGVVDMAYVTESATRLLFLSIYRSRTLPAFHSLRSEQVKIHLMKSAWRDLFTLGLCQRQDILPLKSVMFAVIDRLHLAPSTGALLIAYSTKWAMIAKEAGDLKLTDTEYAILKAIVLFRPGSVPDGDFADDLAKINDLQKSALCQMEECIGNRVKGESKRGGRLSRMLFLVLQLKTITSTMLEDIFFRNCIEPTTSIESLIPYIMKVNANLSISGQK